MAIQDPEIYTAAIDDLLDAGDWDTDNHSAHLFTAYTFAASHATKAGMSMTEHAATGGYSQDGKALSGKAINTVGAYVYLNSDAIEWTSATISANFLVVFKKPADRALDNADIPIFYISLDGGGAVSSTSGSFKVSPHTTGWFSFSS